MLHHLQRGGLGLTRRPGAGDPYFAQVAFLMHFDGSNGSTTFTEVTGRTITPTGNAQLSTTNQKFGTACGLFDGTGDYISTAHTNNLSVSTGDFTIEFWVRFNGVGTVYLIGFKGGSSGNFYPWQFRKSELNKIGFRGFNNTSPTPTLVYFIESSTSVVANQWYHVAGTREGNTLRLWLDGNLEGSATVSSALWLQSGINMTWGSYTDPQLGLNGRLDDLRITAGVCRYTAAFTPPTEAFPDF